MSALVIRDQVEQVASPAMSAIPPEAEIKQCRRIAIRYGKLAAICLASVKLASISATPVR